MEKDTKEIWVQIIHAHECTKHFTLKAEEYDKNFKTFIQPFNELKNVLEHIIRAMSAEVGINEDKNQTYIEKNLDKAIGHEYRAFFDIADWLSISLRERIIETLKPFNYEAISKAIPDYYSSIRSRIDEICDDIANLREKKDIGNGNNLILEAESYEKILNELLAIDKKIRNSVPAIIEIDRAKRYDKMKLVILSSIASFVVALLMALIVYYFKLKP
ncbi:MAG: hypothetical protein ABIF11_11005 [Nitrospirota bacterium]